MTIIASRLCGPTVYPYSFTFPTPRSLRNVNRTGSMVPPLLRHQVSLESVIDLLATPPLSSDERTEARSIFEHIIKHYESYERSNTLTPPRKYKRERLLQLVYDHAISDHGRDNILRYFLLSMTTTADESPSNSQDFSHVLASLTDFKDRNTSEKDKVVQRVQELADHLVDGFFLPRKFVALYSLIYDS